MAGGNQVLFLGRQVLAEINGLARELFGFALTAHVGVGLSKAGISQRELRVLLDRSLELLLGLEVPPLAQQLKALVIVTERRQRFRGGLERLRLELLDDGGREGKVLSDGFGQTIDGFGNRLLVRSFRLEGCGAVLLQILEL